MQLRMLAAGTWYVLVQRTTPGSFRLRLTVGMPTTPPALDLCPAAGSTSPFDLNDGMPHTVSFAGFFGDYSVSCETGAPSPDAVLPLTLTGTRNVTITASPMAGMAGERIVIALQRAPCGVSTSEVPRGCAQVTFFTTPARLVLRGLEAGSYFLVVKQQTGRDVTVQATLTDPGMRIPGDTCPGQDITPDTAPVTVTPTRFDAYADVGTTCGSSTRPEGWTDWVLHFRLTMPRDVTVTATNTGGATMLRMQLQSACMMGAPSAAVGPCVAGAAAVTRRYRGLAAGDYYIVLEGNPAPAGVQVAVTTTAPGVRLPGDSCPGVDVMPDGAPGTLSMSGGFDTTSDYGTACGSTRPLDNWTDWVFHFRLAVPRDVTLTMVGGGTVTRMQLQATCGAGATPIGGCVAATGGTATRRYRGLMAGDYYVVGETSGAVAPAGPIQLIVTTSDPGMRLPGDTCTSPVAVRPDGPPVVIPVAAFDNTPDHGTPCGSGTTPGAIWTDWVASYTLTEERDVLITTTNPSGAQMFQVLEGMCGVGTSALGACTASPPFGGAGITQRFSRQRPGTYFVVGETRASPVPANVTVTVSTMVPGSRPTYTQSVTPAGVPYVSACTAPGAMRFFPSVDDDAALVPLPFAFRFWGAPAAPMVNVTSNGWIGLNGIRDATYSNVPIPNASTPNAMVAALWDDLITGPEGVCVVTTGAMPDRHFVVEWPNVRYLAGGGPFTFEIILNETGSTIDMLYQTVTPPLMDSTVGVENQDGTDAVAVCGGAPCAAVTSGTRLRFSPSPAP
jgi:hypothetical protein